MKNLLLICKGFIIGLAKIIPGVSGAIIAISFGVYEKLISILSRPLKLKFNDLKFLLCLFIGMALGIGLLCKGVKWCLDVYYLPTMLLFIGLIIGGMPEIVNAVKNKMDFKFWGVFFICFFLLYYLININGGDNTSSSSDLYFFIGATESITTIIPGISGTAIFMALGWYDSVLNIYEGISSFNIEPMVIVLFLSGFLISTVLLSKIISYLFSNHKVLAYSGVLGFMMSSIFLMFKDIFSYDFSFLELIIGILLCILGYLITKKINIFFSKL